MSALNVALWVGGVALMMLAYFRGRLSWSRYERLREQEANVARYESWRGGVRDRSTTGASVAMAMYRREALVYALVGVVGFGLIVAGFAVA